MIEDNELPDYLLAEPASEEEEEEDEEKKQLELGRGNRSKKETNYEDQMSEKEWLRAIGAEEEDGDVCTFLSSDLVQSTVN